MYELYNNQIELYKNDYEKLTSLYDDIVESYNYGKLTYIEWEFLLTLYFSYKKELESKMI